MIVVADTSCLQYATQIGALDLIHRLYGEIVVPSAAYQELIRGTMSQNSIHDVPHAPWLAVRDVLLRDRVRELERELDAGEAEAIALAEDMHADLMLMDEKDGRRVALSSGLRVIGLLGCFAEAEAKGIIPAVRPMIDHLLKETDFKVGITVYQLVLKQAGELP